MRSRTWCLSCVFAIFLLTSFCSAASAQTSWNIPRFAPDPAALYQAAATFNPKPGTLVVVLDEEDNYVFDADGKAVHTRYMVYKILAQQAVEGWGGVSLGWEPWHEERPTVRARVLTPDQVVHQLDPKTITDAAAKDEDEDIYGDARVVRAPLPAIAPGAIVEEEDVFKESAPFFGAGVVTRTYFGRPVPVQRRRLVVDAPASLPLKYTIALLPNMQPQKTEHEGRMHLIFEQSPMEALEDPETYLPSDVPGQPHVEFSTGASWQSIAAGYAKIVDEKAAAKDVQGLVNNLVVAKNTREEKAAAIVQFLSREIRYTGVEFGDAALIPHYPAETLKHKYGDCKDKATLAVAMLRAAGVPASVALLNVGTRLQIPADLPGMGHFDHAIVYVPGTPDLWIDVTDQHARLAQVPRSDQGRLALVASPDSTGLLRVPESALQDNQLVEKREFLLADYGPARVNEITEPSGVFESEYRSWYADGDNKEVKKGLTEYVESQYLAKKLDGMERSDPADLAKQFRLTVHAGGARRGFTELDNAVVAIRLEGLFDKLPDELQEREKDQDKNAEAAQEKPRKPRTEDYELPEAFSKEWQYRIVPPTGFQAKPLPPSARIALGPGLLSEEFSAEADGSVRAVLRFELPKRRFSVAEAGELRTKVVQVKEGQPILVYFEPRTQALLNQGKVREAFQVSRELIAQHPKDAIHHSRRAKELLAAGMGQAARDEARAAVKLDPNSALAQKTLAEILEYDLVGRQFRRGSDYAAAEAAFRAAQKLDPEDKEVVGNLAILLEYNHDGERDAPGAKIKEAVAEYQSLKSAELERIGLKNNLPFALFYAGDFAAAKQAAEAVNPQLKAVIVASVAALNGAEAATTEARKRTANDNDLKAILKSSGEMLMRARKYPMAATLMEAGASGNNASNTLALAALLRKGQPHEDIKPENSPAGVVTKLTLQSFDLDVTLERFKALHSRNAQKVIALSDPEDTERSLKTGRAFRNALSHSGFPADIMLDIALPAMQVQPEGDDASGYRVIMKPAGAPKVTTFVVKEQGQYLLLDESKNPNSIGLEILDRLARQDTASARILLDWVREDQHLPGGDDPVAGLAFPRLWTKGKDADSEHMKVAAAAILAQTLPTARGSLPILEAAMASAQSDTERLNLSIALFAAYENLDEYQKLHDLAVQIAKQYPESKRVFFEDQIALRGLGRFAEADALAQDMAKRLPDDPDVLRAPAFTAAAKGDYVTAHDIGKKLISGGKAESGDFNSVAWNSLFTGKTTQEDLDIAVRGAQMNQNNTGMLHTLACVYAELGKTKEAREVLIQTMNSLDLDEPNGDYWYALGRIAEQYGELAVARADYQQAKKPKKPVLVPSSSYQLAQNRLAAMRNVPAQPSR
jgi:tetratricopeptide (TPR) repeat protein